MNKDLFLHESRYIPGKFFVAEYVPSKRETTYSNALFQYRRLSRDLDRGLAHDQAKHIAVLRFNWLTHQ